MRLEGVEGPAHRTIADGVEAHIELRASAAGDHVVQIVISEARRTRTIEHLGRPAAQ